MISSTTGSVGGWKYVRGGPAAGSQSLPLSDTKTFRVLFDSSGAPSLLSSFSSVSAESCAGGVAAVDADEEARPRGCVWTAPSAWGVDAGGGWTIAPSWRVSSDFAACPAAPSCVCSFYRQRRVAKNVGAVGEARAGVLVRWQSQGGTYYH